MDDTNHLTSNDAFIICYFPNIYNDKSVVIGGILLSGVRSTVRFVEDWRERVLAIDSFADLAMLSEMKTTLGDDLIAAGAGAKILLETLMMSSSTSIRTARIDLLDMVEWIPKFEQLRDTAKTSNGPY